MTRRPRRSFMNELMAEPIAMPGCPQLIVTRADCYQWLKAEGYPLVGGYNSVDYMTFRREVSDQPLSSDAFKARAFAAMSQRPDVPMVGLPRRQAVAS